MASIQAALPAVKRDLSRFIDEALVIGACRQSGHRYNACRLTPTVTVQLLVLQLLAGVALAGLRRVAQVSVSAAAICKARLRLPVAVMIRLVEQAGVVHSAEASPVTLWHGLPAFDVG